MRNKKVLKFISLVISLVLLCSVCVPCVSATGKLKISVDSVEANPGDEVTVAVSIDDNPGVINVACTVNFDEDDLTLISRSKTSIFKNATFGKTLNSPFSITCYDDETEEEGITTNGAIVNLTFKVNENAKAGDVYPITLTFGKDAVYDYYEDDVEYTAVNGSVTIPQAAPAQDVVVEQKEKTDAAPTHQGMDFVGWFADEDCTTAFTGATGTAYAKFVSKDVHSVALQFPSNLSATDASTSIRFITTIDTNMYRNVGFIIEYDGVPFTTDAIDTAYTEVIGGGNTYTPQTAFCPASNWFVTYNLTGIESSGFDKTFKARSYWTTLDGTRVEGDETVFTINQYLQSLSN